MMNRKVGRMVLKAEGIQCGGCAEDIEKVLRKTDGILDASVNYAEGSIRLTYDEDLIDRKQVFFAARRLGYKMEIVSGS